MARLKVIIMVLVLLTGCETFEVEESEEFLEEQNQVVLSTDMAEDITLPIGEEEKATRINETLKVMRYYEAYYKSVGDIGEKEIEEIVNILGKKGEVVIDSENKVNMRNSEVMQIFCEGLEEEKEVQGALYRVTIDGGLVRLDFSKEGDNLSVMHTVGSFNEAGEPEINYMKKFKVYEYRYTPKGYLLYRRAYESLAPFGMDYNEGHEAIRIMPLEEECRELCQKYIEPIGYENNNMFLSNWCEADLGELQLNDLFEYLYRLETGEWMDYNVYEQGIEADVFETLVMTYFDIKEERIRECAIYEAECKMYHWNRRLPEDSTYEVPPLPEVIGYRQEADGTMTLIVDAVWAVRGTDQAFTHEVNIRFKENGKFVYTANLLRKQ